MILRNNFPKKLLKPAPSWWPVSLTGCLQKHPRSNSKVRHSLCSQRLLPVPCCCNLQISALSPWMHGLWKECSALTRKLNQRMTTRASSETRLLNQKDNLPPRAPQPLVPPPKEINTPVLIRPSIKWWDGYQQVPKPGSNLRTRWWELMFTVIQMTCPSNGPLPMALCNTTRWCSNRVTRPREYFSAKIKLSRHLTSQSNRTQPLPLLLSPPLMLLPPLLRLVLSNGKRRMECTDLFTPLLQLNMIILVPKIQL